MRKFTDRFLSSQSIKDDQDCHSGECLRCAGVATAALMIYSTPHKYIAAGKREVKFSHFGVSPYIKC